MLDNSLVIRNSKTNIQSRRKLIAMPLITSFAYYHNTRLNLILTSLLVLLSFATLQAQNEIDSLEQALSQSKGKKRIKLLNTLSWKYRNTNLKQSLDYVGKATRLAQSIKDSAGLTQAYNFAGVYYRKLGNYQKAMDLFFDCLKLAEKRKDSLQIAYVFNNMGEIYNYQLDYENAEKYIQQAKEIFEKLQEIQGLAYAYIRLGEIYEAQEKYPLALQYFEDCEKLRLTIDDQRGLAVIYTNIAGIYTKQKNLDKALGYIKKALKLHPKEDKSGIAQSQKLAAQIYLEQGKLAEAHKFAEKSLKLGKDFNAKKIRLEAIQILALVSAEEGKHIQAYELQQKAFALKDSLFAEENAQNINNLRQSYESEKQQLQIDALTRREEAQKAENRLKTTLLYLSLVAFIIISTSLGLLYRNYQYNRKITKRVEEQNEEISGIAENLQAANAEISQKNELIERKNRDMLASINYAQRIQMAMLPTEEMMQNALPEHFVFYRPRDIVSGDFYWIVQKKYQTIVAVADCTGHGIPGAFMSLIGNDLLNEIVMSRNINEPDKILTELRRMIRIALRQKETKNQDGMEISICTIDQFPEGYEDLLGKPKIQFASAGNPLYYFNKKGKIQFIRGSRAVIGGFNPLEREQSFQNHVIEVEDAQTPLTFYMFSDGYQDQFGEKGKFMKRRFRELLQDIHSKPMAEQNALLGKTLDDWRGKHEQIDDIIVLGFRIS